ncbi:enoyl-CoA hydratase [Polaromonas sp. SM01]|uniref:enoyl-CoA hydratase n=1 Tax=Polaromonas sp. SM01 TaxID=3085630 RepID=UPI0029827AEB|nr:enoyl-CoA hydratase [Polaromonas sp. SM01]MDW5441885.1 enoyl-CoA hydratase [Polaromonas sp. SM01]
MSELVRLSVTEGVAQILIQRPERHNAMTQAMYERLLQLLDECNANAEVQAVVFRGAGGRSFISGTDIQHFAQFSQGREGVQYEAFVETVIDAIERMRVPTIAAIDGWAVGGGLAIATACDFRVCSHGARFGAPIAKTLSNTLSSRNIARLMAAFGAPRVKRMLMLAEYLDVQEATACGFVYSACAPEELEASAHGLALKLAGLSRVTQHAVKESMRRIVVDQDLADQDLIDAVYGSAAFKAGVASFLKT